MESLEYQLQKMEPGVVVLDREGIIRAANPLARRILENYHPQVIGRAVVDLHPEPSRRKIAWLLQEAAQSDAGTLAPVTMTINTPDRALLLSISRLEDPQGAAGFCLLFYDLKGLSAAVSQAPRSAARRLAKLPVDLGGGTALVDPAEVVHLQAEGHYARLFTARDSFLCHLSLAQLEARLDGEHFLRVHRSHLIAITYAARLEKEDGRQWVVMATFPSSRIPIGRSRAAAVAARLGL
ncbi:MAG TPA: LytTR family transcriptional regulator DNA-binding domain-containing protein [Azospira sp.]|nr:LytTR family transcriptional regulator DNA-binding domain-containing protein [Azospira sp.]